MSDLHARIMNIPCVPPDVAGVATVTAYKMGHRDARHAAAAEIVALSRAPTISAAIELPEVRALVDAAIKIRQRCGPMAEDGKQFDAALASFKT